MSPTDTTGDLRIGDLARRTGHDDMEAMADVIERVLKRQPGASA